jgi:PadR family transcriptional regulator, regulatory protein PadR
MNLFDSQKIPCSCAMVKLYRFTEPVLLLLLRQKEKAYGYELVQEVNEHALTGTTIERGAIYRTLRTLEKNGHVISTWDVSGAGPARRHYRLTPRGEEHLQEWTVILERLAESMLSFTQETRAFAQPDKADLNRKSHSTES